MSAETVKVKIKSDPPVEIEGTREDIQKILKEIGIKSNKEKYKSKRGSKGNKSIRELIIELIEDEFFVEPKTLPEIVNKLEKKGYNYPSSSVYPVLLRDFIRQGLIERKGEKRNYQYYIDLE